MRFYLFLALGQVHLPLLAYCLPILSCFFLNDIRNFRYFPSIEHPLLFSFGPTFLERVHFNNLVLYVDDPIDIDDLLLGGLPPLLPAVVLDLLNWLSFHHPALHQDLVPQTTYLLLVAGVLQLVSFPFNSLEVYRYHSLL